MIPPKEQQKIAARGAIVPQISNIEFEIVPTLGSFTEIYRPIYPGSPRIAERYAEIRPVLLRGMKQAKDGTVEYVTSPKGENIKLEPSTVVVAHSLCGYAAVAVSDWRRIVQILARPEVSPEDLLLAATFNVVVLSVPMNLWYHNQIPTHADHRLICLHHDGRLLIGKAIPKDTKQEYVTNIKDTIELDQDDVESAMSSEPQRTKRRGVSYIGNSIETNDERFAVGGANRREASFAINHSTQELTSTTEQQEYKRINILSRDGKVSNTRPVAISLLFPQHAFIPEPLAALGKAGRTGLQFLMLLPRIG